MSNRVVVLPGAGPPRTASSASHAPLAPPAPRAIWVERFNEPQLAWFAPLGHSEDISKVYSVQRDDGITYLHAVHDCRPGAERIAFLHFGKRFDPHPPALDRVRALRWKWRVLEHPNNGENMWEDVAASVYVIIKVPSVFGGGKGFRFGWLAGQGSRGTKRMGLERVPLREEPATQEWKSEEVDLCARYRQVFGPCEGQVIQYIGVATEADGTDSVSAADYTDFELIGATP